MTMISNDQDAVAQRAREATPADVAPPEDKELREASRALEKEPESTKAYELLVAVHARRGMPEPLDRKPVSAMSARELARSRNNYPSDTAWDSPERKRYYLLETAKTELADEIAAARVLARKGLAPDPKWTGGSAQADERDEEDDAGRKIVEDPRLAAWKTVAWARAKEALDRSRSVPAECPSLDGIATLEKEAEAAHRTLKAIRELLEGGAK